MILKITEYCAWENESWSYLIDMDKQQASAINFLMVFIRCANRYFEEVEREAKKQPPALTYHPLFNRNPRNPFSASSYRFMFYDRVEETEKGVKVVNSQGRLWLSDNVGYKNATNMMLDRKISIARIKSALISVRDKNENKLYKNFESVFLAQKHKPVTA